MLPFSLVLAAALATADPGAPNESDRTQGGAEIAARIDQLMTAHWQAAGVTPGEPADDATFLRRVTLDLTGRIPTAAEAQAFATDATPAKRSAAIRRLMNGPEYPLHLGRVLEGMIQGRHAGNSDGLAGWLREAAAEGRGWDVVFQQLMLGPWEAKEQKPADQFLSKRVRNIDELTNDTARVFFGVDISCAKCHDHPLVDAWKQQHYYGLASFLNRTESKDKQGISEKDAGEVQFVDTKGARHTAQLMFLTGQVVTDPKLDRDPRWRDRREADKKAGKKLTPAFSPREQLVRTALEEKQFLSRAIANKLWAWLLGRGLVHPIDQMHADNTSTVPGVLELLADDAVTHGYRLDRLVAGIVESRAYQLESVWNTAAAKPAPEHFALANVRALTPEQFAFSLVLAAGEPKLDESEPEKRSARYRDLEGQSRGLLKPLDKRTDDFQASVTEALFMSNNAAVQQVVAPAGKNLAARLAAIADAGELVDAASWAVLSRGPTAGERDYLVRWLGNQGEDRTAACARLVWALSTSAEFRFNH